MDQFIILNNKDYYVGKFPIGPTGPQGCIGNQGSPWMKIDSSGISIPVGFNASIELIKPLPGIVGPTGIKK